MKGANERHLSTSERSLVRAIEDDIESLLLTIDEVDFSDNCRARNADHCSAALPQTERKIRRTKENVTRETTEK